MKKRLIITMPAKYRTTLSEASSVSEKEYVILRGIPLREGMDGRQATLERTLSFELTEQDITSLLLSWLDAMVAKLVIVRWEVRDEQ